MNVSRFVVLSSIWVFIGSLTLVFGLGLGINPIFVISLSTVLGLLSFFSRNQFIDTYKGDNKRAKFLTKWAIAPALFWPAIVLLFALVVSYIFSGASIGAI